MYTPKRTKQIKYSITIKGGERFGSILKFCKEMDIKISTFRDRLDKNKKWEKIKIKNLEVIVFKYFPTEL